MIKVLCMTNCNIAMHSKVIYYEEQLLDNDSLQLCTDVYSIRIKDMETYTNSNNIIMFND